jgi:RNA polymerase sigma-70 factor (ECF subfamily)
MRAEREWDRLAADDYELQNLESVNEEQAIADIEPLIGNLSLASRVVIAMRYLEDLKQEEIAAALGISVGTVKSRIAYGLMQLRKAAVT